MFQVTRNQRDARRALSDCNVCRGYRAALCISALSTEDKLEYHFYPVSAGQIQFRVRAPNDAHIALTTGPNEGDPMYEVGLRFRTFFLHISDLVKESLLNYLSLKISPSLNMLSTFSFLNETAI